LRRKSCHDDLNNTLNHIAHKAFCIGRRHCVYCILNSSDMIECVWSDFQWWAGDAAILLALAACSWKGRRR